jgi:non-ribosomal peptide synthetase component F
VRDVALGAYAHQDLPFEKLVQELRPDRDPRANPLVQSVLTYRNAVQPSDSGAQFQVIEIDKGTSPFDLLLSVTEARDGLSAAVSYATDLFADHTIERLMSRFVVLLDAIAQDPNQRISDIRLTARNEADELKISRFAKLKLSQKDMESLLDQVSEVLQ